MNLNLLISIKPKYVKEIINGRKKYEFRKRIFKKNVDKIYIYSTAPDKRIVGYFEYKGYLKDTPKCIWEKTVQFSGITEDEYFKYLYKKEDAYAIEIEQLYVFDIPIDPFEKIIGFVAPQSYKYVDGDL